MGWSGAASGVTKAGEGVVRDSAGRTIAQGAAAAGGVLAAGAALGEVTGGKIPNFTEWPGNMLEFSFSSAPGQTPETPEVKAIRERYFPRGQTAAQKGEAGQRLWNDALNREREWRNSAIEAQHPDWTEAQVAREWVRYFLGDNAARSFTFKPG